MKRIIRLGALSLAIGALAIGAMAQKPGPGAGGPKPPQGGDHKFGGPGGGGMRGGGMLEHMKKELNLTPAQVTKLEALMKANRAKMEAARKNMKPGTKPSEADMAKWKASRDAQHKQMMAILTPAQQKKWEAMRKNMGGRMMRPGNGPPPPNVKGGTPKGGGKG